MTHLPRPHAGRRGRAKPEPLLVVPYGLYERLPDAIRCYVTVPPPRHSLSRTQTQVSLDRLLATLPPLDRARRSAGAGRREGAGAGVQTEGTAAPGEGCAGAGLDRPPWVPRRRAALAVAGVQS